MGRLTTLFQFIALCTILIAPSFASAEITTFALRLDRINDNSGSAVARNIFQREDSTFVLTGGIDTTIDDAPLSRITLSQISRTGDFEWSKDYRTYSSIFDPSEEDEFSSYAQSVIYNHDSTQFVIGTFLFSNTSNSDLGMFRTNLGGVLKDGTERGFNQAYNMNEFGGFVLPIYGEYPIDTPGYLLIGSAAEGPSSNQRDIFVIRTDTAGQLMWRKKYGNVQIDEFAYNATFVEQDSTYLIVGHQDSSATPEKILAMRITSTGHVRWANIYYASIDHAEVAYHALELRDSNFIISGTTSSFPGSAGDMFMLKIEPQAGVPIWHKVYGTPLPARNNLDVIYAVMEDDERNLIAVGKRQDVLTTAAENDGAVVKTNPWGQVIWTKWYNTGAYAEFFDVIQTADSGYALAGYVASSAGNSEMLIIKTNKEGRSFNTCDSLRNFLIPEDTLGIVHHPLPFAVTVPPMLYHLNMKQASGEFAKFTCSTPLPVQLLEFDGEPHLDHNALTWSTGVEVNHDYFEVQRSSDGVSFEPMAVVRNPQESGVINTYEFDDSKVHEDVLYYRLRQVDLDGSYTYSDVVVIHRQGEGVINASMYPNPANDRLTLNYQSNQNLMLSVYDLSGRLVYERRLDTENIVIETTDWKNGLYTAFFHNEQFGKHVKIQIVH